MKYLLALLLLIFIVFTLACERPLDPQNGRMVSEEKTTTPAGMGGDPDSIGLEARWVTTLEGVFIPPQAEIPDETLVKAYRERPTAPYAGRPMYVTWGQIKAHYRV